MCFKIKKLVYYFTAFHTHKYMIKILLHGVFDPSPDLSPSRPYQPEPEGRGLIYDVARSARDLRHKVLANLQLT